ncbi:glycosyltransferase family 9 protein [Uliginosibacterium sediminicola]|uniref:Glycosyltransferase family 9 protein n=1 Tax=Uliginosibacterium sediminicola TaxID=2024550 RepID=A0ABU9YU82_9RHOO
MSQTQVQALLQQVQLDAALDLLNEWLQREPQSTLALQYQGLTRLWLGDAVAAEASFRAALALDPTLPRNQANLGISLLAQQRYAEGLPLYEARDQVDGPRFPGLTAQRRWQGEALAGRRLLLVREQGFGDQIQFIRFAAELKALSAGAVIASVSPGLGSLLASAPGVDALSEGDIPSEAYDLWCPLMSLPCLLGIAAPPAPARLPYLHAPAAQHQHWQQRIDAWAGDKPRIGVVWAGSAQSAIDTRRTLPAALMLEILHARGQAVAFSLQLGDAALTLIDQQIAAGLIPLFDLLQDFADTAAVIEQLDLVISVDTAVAHLAAALGKPVWLLLPVGADWRWGQSGEQTPWYPSMRIFRQTQYGNWRDVALSVAGELQRGLA